MVMLMQRRLQSFLRQSCRVRMQAALSHGFECLVRHSSASSTRASCTATTVLSDLLEACKRSTKYSSRQRRHGCLSADQSRRWSRREEKTTEPISTCGPPTLRTRRSWPSLRNPMMCCSRSPCRDGQAGSGREGRASRTRAARPRSRSPGTRDICGAA